ncbi:MAG: head-tail adaptor protein [Pacificimonas sp.]
MSEVSGALSERVEILEPGGRGRAGEALPFAVGEVRWAAFAPLRDGVGVRGERLSGKTRWRVTMRVGVSPRAGDRLRWRGQDLRVVSWTIDPRRADVMVLLVEGAG